MGFLVSRFSEMRKGSRYISDEEPVFLAEGAGIVRELVLLGVHADKNENPTIKALWEGIAKKYNGLGITINTITYMGICTVLTSTLIQTSKYALGILC